MESPNPKKKDALKSEGGISKEGKCFHCDKPGHLKKKETVQFILKIKIDERRISKLHKDGLLDPFVFKQIDVCESCLLGKMTKAPVSGERASDLLGLMHSDVCGPMNTQDKSGFQYFITFTDDFSRHGYIYLMRHKSETLERFKEFKNEINS
ncbi:hypothetical protein GQ457_12G015640 [Hibiscus cannabinus]